MKSLMRVIGAVTVVAGLFILGRAYMADTTIETETFGRVHNIGLMEKKRSDLTMGGVVAGVGCAIFLAGEIGGKK